MVGWISAVLLYCLWVSDWWLVNVVLSETIVLLHHSSRCWLHLSLWSHPFCYAISSSAAAGWCRRTRQR